MTPRLAAALVLIAFSPACEAPPQKPSPLEARVASLETDLKSLRSDLSASNRQRDALVREMSKLQALLEENIAATEQTEQTEETPPAAEAEDDEGRPAPPEPVAAPTPEPPPPSQSVRYLAVNLVSLRVLNRGEIEVTLQFHNTDSSKGLAVAHRAENSDGIADFWKFFPKPIGSVTDEKGVSHPIQENSPLGFARDNKDWLILNAGEKITHVFKFGRVSGGLPGVTFTVAIDLRVVTRDDRREQQQTISTVVFPKVRPTSG